MVEKSVELFLIGKTVKRKLIVSHLFSSLVPFLVVLYMLVSYVLPRMPEPSVHPPFLIAIAVLIGVLVSAGYYVSWDLGRCIQAVAKRAEMGEGFEAFLERADEIGAIMRAFSQTLETLKRRNRELNELSGSLDHARHELEAMELKLRELALVDELTGLYNRKFFGLVVEQEIGRSDRYSRRFSLVLFDVDHLSRINEERGSANGDRILAEVGQILKTNSRVCDYACRFGGEEFGVVLPETESDGARAYAERILRTVRGHGFILDDESIMSATLSAGVAAYPSGGTTAEELVGTVEQALYRAKEEGRDRVCTQEEPAQ